MNTLRCALVAILVAVALAPGALAAADLAGEIVLARGVVTAYSAGGAARILGARSQLMVGEVVSTGVRSLAVLSMTDGTRITLRPETTFEITAFEIKENQENALFTLFKGGLRSVTGFLSKRNPNAVRLRTSVATIGIRGTEFDARLCDADCAREAARRPVPAGRVGFLRGKLLARATSGAARSLAAGGPVYVGDTLISDASSYAVVAFRDESRVTLLPGTEFRVDDLSFTEAEPDSGTAVFRLLRGGLRAVTGLIGKRGGKGYRMNTAVATIGIRGTGYDLLCVGSCQNPDVDAGPDGDGLFAAVWDGSITVDEVSVVETGETKFIATSGFTPLGVPGMPVPIEQPLPTSVEIAPAPAASSSTNPAAGLYVSCYVGNCAVETDGNTVELSAGEAGFVGSGGSAEQLTEIPPFQAEDPVLHAAELGSSVSQFNQILDSGVGECSVR